MTDHLPLCHLNKLNNLQGRLQRWLWDISEVRHTIKYVPGKSNKLADSLSRLIYAGYVNRTAQSIQQYDHQK